MKGKQKNSKSRRKPMDRRNSSKNMRRDAEVLGTDSRELRSDEREYRDARSKPNDPAWYAHSPQIIKDFASLPFGNPLGSQLPQNLTTAMGTGSISGIMTLYYAPTIGRASNESDAINVAMRNIYSYVRHANSGHANYDAPDLMMYLLAMDSVYMFHAWLKRLYGQLMLATTYNRYYPKALIEAEGVSFDDLQSHITDFRGYINLLAVRMGSMAVPNSMSYMARHSWMTEGLYVDDPSTPKAQTYKYVPSHYYQFSLQNIDSTYVGQLQYASLIVNSNGIPVNSKVTFDQIVAFGNSLLNPILANEDMNIMSGDILKAFGQSGIVQVSGITETYLVLPAYSAEVLSQIENATIYSGAITGGVTQNIEVGGGYLVSSPSPSLVSNYSYGPSSWPTVTGMNSARYGDLAKPMNSDRLFNMHHQEVSPDEVMVATRLSSVWNSTLNGSISGGRITLSGPVLTCGSEIVTRADIWNFSYTGSPGFQLISSPFSTVMPIAYVKGTPIEDIVQYIRLRDAYIAQVTQFDWHPPIYPAYVGFGTAGGYTITNQPNCMFSDVSNYTVLTVENIQNMDAIALLSEFSVPQIGLMGG